MLSGCRRNEILALRWDDLNFDTNEMRLPDTKKGTRMVPLTPAVARVFDGLARTTGNPWVFPGKKKSTRLVNLNDSWNRVGKDAGLEGVRLHLIYTTPPSIGYERLNTDCQSSAVAIGTRRRAGVRRAQPSASTLPSRLQARRRSRRSSAARPAVLTNSPTKF